MKKDQSRRPPPKRPPENRSRIDRLADRAPRGLRKQAGGAALALDKLATAVGPRVRRRPAPYALAAIAIGVGAGLLAYGPSRRAIGSRLGNLGRSSLGGLGRQLGRELRSLIR